jgi:hypothetical protein
MKRCCTNLKIYYLIDNKIKLVSNLVEKTKYAVYIHGHQYSVNPRYVLVQQRFIELSRGWNYVFGMSFLIMANAGPIFTNVVGRFGKFRKRRPISSITSSIGKRFGDTIGVH